MAPSWCFSFSSDQEHNKRPRHDGIMVIAIGERSPITTRSRTRVVKFMSDENAEDADSRKTFRLLAGVDSVEFVRGDDGAIACLTFSDGSIKEETLRGNAYVMNDSGKTVSSFGICALPPDSAVAPSLRTA